MIINAKWSGAFSVYLHTSVINYCFYTARVAGEQA